MQYPSSSQSSFYEEGILSFWCDPHIQQDHSCFSPNVKPLAAATVTVVSITHNLICLTYFCTASSISPSNRGLPSSGASSARREESVVVLEKHPSPLGSQCNTLDQQLQQTEVWTANDLVGDLSSELPSKRRKISERHVYTRKRVSIGHYAALHGPTRASVYYQTLLFHYSTVPWKICRNILQLHI